MYSYAGFWPIKLDVDFMVYGSCAFIPRSLCVHFSDINAHYMDHQAIVLQALYLSMNSQSRISLSREFLRYLWHSLLMYNMQRKNYNKKYISLILCVYNVTVYINISSLSAFLHFLCYFRDFYKFVSFNNFLLKI